MAQDDARLVAADRAAEDAVAPAGVALRVRPLGQLVGRGRVAERHGALPHDEAEHDPGRLRTRAHAGNFVPRSAPGGQGRRRLDFRPPPPACHRPVIPDSTAPGGAQPAAPRTGRSFTTFALPEPVAAGIRAAGFTHCTPIQEKVLPLALAGRDVAGQAQTGTGKTAAFLITIFTRLLARERPERPAAPRALVIAPTRELVVQIASDAHLLGQATPFAIQAVYGGIDYHKQRSELRAGVDVLIGTPGRLIDYYKQRVFDLRSAEILIIDEADRMFDMGFIKDLRYILRQLPPYDRRQSMLFSATLSYDVMELAYVFMNDAVKVSASPEQVTAENVEHLVYHVGTEEKLPLLVGLLRRESEARVLIFVNMRRSAERLERHLAANHLKAAAITGDVDQ